MPWVWRLFGVRSLGIECEIASELDGAYVLGLVLDRVECGALVD